MTDVKYIDVPTVKIGYDDTNSETIGTTISFADKLVARDGDLVKPVAAINDKVAIGVRHSHRYWLVEHVMDGFNYEALFEEQVQTGGGEPQLSTRAIRQGADNDFIEHLVITKTKAGGGTDTITYESGRIMLSGFHLSVSNRKGRKYQPTTIRYKVRGNRT